MVVLRSGLGLVLREDVNGWRGIAAENVLRLGWGLIAGEDVVSHHSVRSS